MPKLSTPKIWVAAFVAAAFIVLFFLGHRPQPLPQDSNSHLEYATGRITQLIANNTVQDPAMDHFPRGTVVYEVQMLRGTFAGTTLEANYHMNSPIHVLFQVGDRVSVRIFEFDGEIMIAEIRHPERTELLLGAVALFLLFLCFIGGKRGILAAAGLIFTVASVLFLLIPLILAGYPVVFVTLLVLALVIVATITLLAGTAAKGLAAILGSLFGLGFAAVLAWLVGSVAHVSGYNMGDYRAIFHLSNGARVEGLFISSVLVASIGAVMDTTMSVASAMAEVKAASPQMDQKALFKAGFNVSRDVMGTMSSTLILAFIGGSLSLIIFMYTTGVTFNQFINHDAITMEIIKGIAGSFGIVLAAPFTAWIAAKLLTGHLY